MFWAQPLGRNERVDGSGLSLTVDRAVILVCGPLGSLQTSSMPGVEVVSSVGSGPVGESWPCPMPINNPTALTTILPIAPAVRSSRVLGDTAIE